MLNTLWSMVLTRMREPLETARRDARHLSRTLRGELAPAVVLRSKRGHAFVTSGAPTPSARSLKVVEVRRETPDATTLVFEALDGTAVGFVAGQFLTLRLTIEGASLRRAYSASSSANDTSRVSITVKRVPGGVVSNHLNDRVSVGDTFEALGPSGSFTLPRTGEARRCVLLAGGSGITPMMSFLRTHLGASPELHFTLLYGNRDAASVIFGRELAEMAARHPDQLRVVYALERPSPDLAAIEGRLDEAALSRALDDIALDETSCFLCGPAPMMAAARAVLTARGVPASRIAEERFTLGRTRTRESGAPRLVTLRAGAAERTVTVAAGATVLDAGLMANIDVPYSCTMGGCGACRVKLLAGEVVMDEPNCLTAAERADGYVLACCARPVEAAGEVRVEVSP